MQKLSTPLQRELFFITTVACLWLLVLLNFFSEPIQLFLDSWPIIIIAFLGAVVANATAVGGGFIFVPLFTFFYDLSAIQSLKLALSTQAFGMTTGALSWPRRLIVWPYFFLACGASSLGMMLGTFFWIPSNELIHQLFGYASIVIGAVLFIEATYSSLKEKQHHRLAMNQWAVCYFFVCIAGGLITAWVSIGIGEVVAMWMLFQARYSIASSVATGVAVLAFCSVLGFIFHNIIGGIVWHYLIFTSIGVIFGGRVGAKFGARLASTNKFDQPPLLPRRKTFSEKPLKLFVAAVILLDGIVVIWLNQPASI